MKIKILAFILLSLVFPAMCGAALTPIARVDVVPYQRINAGDSFNFGVVAFSKEGIDRVEFSISGGGYSGGTKTASSMTLNSRTDVWEYWVTFSGFEFSTDGAITVTSTVYGGEGDTRVLTTPMLVNPNGTLAQYEAWVDATNGNNSTGTVGNSSAPYLTIAGATSAVVAANGGSGDGATIYLEEGSYSAAGLSPNASGEWLTIARAEGAAKANTIINAGTATVDMVCIRGIVVQRTSTLIFGWSISNRIWADNVEAIGSGQWISPQSYPIAAMYEYWTDSTVHTVMNGPREAQLVRDTDVYDYGEDAFYNCMLIINSTTDGQDNGGFGENHADGYQMETDPTAGGNQETNRILYGVKMYDGRMDGIYMQTGDGVMDGLALVNVLAEMREPAQASEQGAYAQTALGINNGDGWDHILIWNCSFPYARSIINFQYLTNASIIGNLFWSMDSGVYADRDDPNITYVYSGNVGNNEMLHNHFTNVYVDNTVCDIIPTQYTYDGLDCPFYGSVRPDSNGDITSATVGDPLITSDIYPLPEVGSVLIDRFTSLVPVDIDNNVRGAISDIGAFEYGAGGTVTPTSSLHKALFGGKAVFGGRMYLSD